jgi:hypothetical protein
MKRILGRLSHSWRIIKWLLKELLCKDIDRIHMAEDKVLQQYISGKLLCVSLHVEIYKNGTNVELLQIG